MFLQNRCAPSLTNLIRIALIGAELAGCSQAHITSTEPAPPPVTNQLATPGGLLKLGDDVRRQGDANGALAIYQAASSQDSRDVAVLSRIGFVSIDLGQPLRAEQAFLAMLTMDAQNVDARFGLGVSLLAEQRVSDALPVLSTLAQNTTDVRLLRGYAVALDMAGQSAEAQRYYRQALAQAPNGPELTNWPSGTHKRTKLEHGYTKAQAGRAFRLFHKRAGA